MSRVRLAIYLGENGTKLGRGKVALLREIGERGSISAAARAMGMAYRHAWEMVDELNRCFAEPLVVKSTGGRRGGGAGLTPWGREVVVRFDEMERLAGQAIGRQVGALDRRLARRASPRGRARSRKP